MSKELKPTPAAGENAVLSDADICDIFKRRTKVEQALYDMSQGRRPMPTPEELRDLAIQLGTPSEFYEMNKVKPC